MSDRRFFDYDPLTKITQYFHWDHETETYALESEQDVTAYLEQNKRLYNEDDFKRKGYKDEMVHVAQIPLIVIEKWLREDGIDVYNPDHKKAVMRKLNHPDYLYLRTTSGRI